MTLKSITLHRAATDNTGAFKDAGAELTVGDAEKPDFIAADRARELLGNHGATGHYSKPPAAKSAAAKAPAKKSAPKLTSAPAQTGSDAASSTANG